MSQLAKMPFKMYWRLNAECAWQPAWPIGNNFTDAKVCLLLAVKTIYRIGGNDIQIVEHLSSPNDACAGAHNVSVG